MNSWQFNQLTDYLTCCIHPSLYIPVLFIFHLDNKLFYFSKLIKKFWEIDENHNLCFPVNNFINQLYFFHLTYSIHFVVTWGVRNLVWIHGVIRTNPQTIWARTQEWMRNCTGLPNEMHKYSFLYTPLYS